MLRSTLGSAPDLHFITAGKSSPGQDEPMQTNDRNWRVVDELTASRVTRRRALGALGTLGTVALLGAGAADGAASSNDLPASSTLAGTKPGSPTSCVLTPEQTEGPFPLFEDIAGAAAYRRQDITEGKTGIPLRLTLTMFNVNSSCAPITNALVYVWHCDKDGIYSGYEQPDSDTTGQTFLRGVQATDGDGRVTFLTVYPGWYPGRITHVHFRVYLGKRLQATSQLAFPQDITTAVYKTPLYAAHGQNKSVTRFSEDNVFSDGPQHQMLSLARNSSSGGYDAALTVGIAI
jgi:protocatechuate 3,4-dioxygenase beta subunit